MCQVQVSSYLLSPIRLGVSCEALQPSLVQACLEQAMLRVPPRFGNRLLSNPMLHL